MILWFSFGGTAMFQTQSLEPSGLVASFPFMKKELLVLCLSS